MLTSTAARALMAGLPRAAIARPLVLRAAPLAHRSLTASAWSLKEASSAPRAAKEPKTTETKTKKPKAKEPKEKKSPAKKAKKAATKDGETAVKAKRGPKPKPKPPLSEEQQHKLMIKQLKEWALFKSQPSEQGRNAYNIFCKKTTTYYGEAGGASHQEKLVAASKSKAEDWRNLPASEREEYEVLAAENRRANERAKGKWIESQPPELILMAQYARRRLAKEEKGHMEPLHDERIPKRPGTALSYFVKSRFQKTDGKTTTDTFKALIDEWMAMSDAEKQPFIDFNDSEVKHSSTQRNELKVKAKEYWREHSTHMSRGVGALLTAILGIK
jgi:uncharacterized low-complexity protein